MKTKFTLILISIGFLSNSIYAQPVMVKDISPGLTSSNPTNLIEINGNVWFLTKNLTNDTTFLNKSDGTITGTVTMIALPQNTNTNLRAFNNQIIFSSSMYSSNQEPWITDGTISGTHLIKDIYPGNGSSAATMIGSLGTTAFLYGFNSNGTNDLGIYKTDGTSSGTSLLFTLTTFSKAISFKNKMYFWGTYNSISGLWSFDANSTQPTMIAQHTNSTYDFALVVGSNLFYYVASDPLYGYEPWVSDGTVAGTKLLKDIKIGTASSCDDGSSGSYTSMAILNNKLYFNPTNDTYGRELWVSDGTTTGTNMFVELTPGITSGNPRNLLAVGNKLFFDARYPGYTSDFLWVSDETVSGTQIRRDNNNTLVQVNGKKFGLNNTVFFNGTTDEATIGIEPYTSDGTGPGTHIIADINPNQYVQSISSSFQQLPVVIGSTIYFIANNSVNGGELWKYSDNSSPNSIYTQNSQNNIKMYPNPSTGKFNIELPNNDKIMSIQVYNMFCEKVSDQQSTNNIDLSKSAKGIYFVYIYDGIKIHTGKIVVQ